MEKTVVVTELEKALRSARLMVLIQIERLTEKKKSIDHLLEEFDDEETLKNLVPLPVPPKGKEIKVTKSRKKGQVNVKVVKSKSGLMKFSQALQNVFISKPDIPYTSKDLVKIMTKEIEAGRCNASKKDMTSAVSAYIWNFSQRGLLKKSGDGFLWIGKERNNDKADKVEWVNDLDLLDEAIIEILKRSEEMSEDGIIHDVRICSSYGDIARNLNGSLASEVQKHLQRLTAVNLVINHNGNLSFNHKADL